MVGVVLERGREDTSRFYVWMAVACVLIAFGGFAPTYWLQLPAGTFVGPPLLHIHGVLFSSWTLLLLSQALLAANGRLENHRAWGLVGISLATAMFVIGLVPSLILEVLIVAGIVYGWRTRGRAHQRLRGAPRASVEARCAPSEDS